MSNDLYRRTVAVMGTLVTIQVVGEDADPSPGPGWDDAIERAFGWFHRIERNCSRFDPQSEAMQLTVQIGIAVPVSDMLFEAVRFAVTVAEETGGAFDPAVGHRMETLGFNREHRTGQIVRTVFESDGPVSYRDIRLDSALKTITLLRPLILDLGAVAKGLAIDMAARELQPLVNYAIDAGGDLYLGGHRQADEPWCIGIRHPRRDEELIDTIQVSNVAVCTSGDYERRSELDGHPHHIIDPRTGRPTDAVASATVVAPTAMLADALATAAFVLGPADGIRLLERHGVDGLILSPALEQHATRGMYRDYNLGNGIRNAPGGGSTILPNTQRTAHDRARDADRGSGAGRGHHTGRARPD